MDPLTTFILGVFMGIFWDGVLSICYHVCWKDKLWRGVVKMAKGKKKC